MTATGFIGRNRKKFFGGGIFLMVASIFFVRVSMSMSFNPLKQGATVHDAATDIANSMLSPWVTAGSLVGAFGMLCVVIGAFGLWRFDEAAKNEDKVGREKIFLSREER